MTTYRTTPNTTFRITSRTTLSLIREILIEDGYGHLAPRAAEIKRAALKGALLWSPRRLTTTDASRIDEVGPEARREATLAAEAAR